MTLSSACANTLWAAAPGMVRDRVLDLVADTIAVMALGSGRPELCAVADEMRMTAPEGHATVVGASSGWPASLAMLINAMAVAADQLQDGHRMARGHPASHVVPAVLAVAEEHDASGAETLSAVLAGYEVGVRIGQAMGGTPPGTHDIGTWGAVAAAAGVARLLRPGDVAASERAIWLAASAVLLTDAATIFEGRTGGHAFLGASVQLGATLGISAVAGLEPLNGALDRHLRTVAAQAWSGSMLDDIDDSWGERFEVLEGYIKTHPTCAHLHGINDAVADIVGAGHPEGRRLRPADIAEVEVRTYGGAAVFNKVAEDELAARFSVPTSIAVAIVTGRLDETTMTTQTVRSPEVRRVAELVRVVHDPALDAGYPSGRPAEVRVVLRDGVVLVASASRPRGDAERALTRHEIRAKASRLLRHRFGEPGAEVLTAIDGLAEGGTARDLGEALRQAARRHQRRT